MSSNHLILCCPLLLLPSMSPSIRVFSNESALCIRWPKYWSFTFSTILPMNIQVRFPLGLISLISLQSKGLSRVFSNTTPSVQFSHSIMSNYLRPHGLQHSRSPCPSPTPGVYSTSCPSSRGYHPTTSSSVVPFSSCLQSFPASGSFPMSQLFASGGQSIGASASALVLPVNIKDWFPLGLTALISLLSKGLSRVFFRTTF